MRLPERQKALFSTSAEQVVNKVKSEQVSESNDLQPPVSKVVKSHFIPKFTVI